MTHDSATFVLVHGAWSDQSIWAPLAQILRAKGHRVLTPTLSGVGRRSHLMRPDIGIADHVEDVVQEIRFEEARDVVLVGHSYGGMVITGVADRIPERISSLVYLDAFLPEDGQAIVDFQVSPPMVEMQLAARDRGEHEMPFPAAFIEEFQIPAEDMWRFTPHPLACFVEPIRLSGAHKAIPKKTYVWATAMKDGFKEFHDRVVADPAWQTVTVPTNHIVQLEAPEHTAQILQGAIRQGSGHDKPPPY
jgi:pimeloyl-ACP methyl ester carboxylesterase